MNSDPGDRIPFHGEYLRVRDVVEECERQAVRPQDGDPYIQAFAGAVSDHLRHGELGINMSFALDMRAVDTPTPATMFNVLRCAVQKQLLARDPVGYPLAGYDQPAKFHQAISDLMSIPDAQDELLGDLAWRRIQTNIGERYKAHKIILAALSHRLGERPSFMDVGCSDLQGPKQLRYSYLVPFVDINGELPEESISRLNSIIHSPEGVPGQIVGIDATRPDMTHMEWIIACTFKPAELARGERLEAFTKLHKLESKEIYGHWKAFDETGMAAYDPSRFESSADLSRFDVITFTTMLNQVKDTEVDAKRQLARKFLKPNGIIIYQDRFMADPQDQSKLLFLEHYNDYNYRTLIEFGDDPSHTLYELMQWETGRCHTLRPGPYLDDLLAGQLG